MGLRDERLNSLCSHIKFLILFNDYEFVVTHVSVVCFLEVKNWKVIPLINNSLQKEIFTNWSA